MLGIVREILSAETRSLNMRDIKEENIFTLIDIYSFVLFWESSSSTLLTEISALSVLPPFPTLKFENYLFV